MSRTGLWNRMSEAEKNNLAKFYQEGTSLWGLHREFGVNAASVKKYLCEQGIHVRTHQESQKEYTHNEDVFSGILSEEAKYWVGMLITDGCVHIAKRGAPLTILTLKRSDKPHLDKFLHFLGSDAPVYDKTKVNKKTGKIHFVSYVSIRSLKLAQALQGYGVTPRKSKTCEVRGLEGSIPFWRGALDGDGEINMIRNSPRIVFSGSRIMTLQFAAFCTYQGVPYPSVVKNGSVFKCQMFGPRAVQILKLLYLPCAVETLERKQQKTEAILATYTGALKGSYHPRRQRSLVTKDEVDFYLARISKKENPDLAAGVSEAPRSQ